MEEIKTKDEKFIPKGAIAFFVVLIASAAILWFSLYTFLLNK